MNRFLYFNVLEAKHPFVSRGIVASLVCILSLLAKGLNKTCMTLDGLNPKFVYRI